jgi:DNA-binding FadR family transcriptional regulator
MLADELRERILNGNFGEGAMLPPERQIVDATGLGRGSVREALRVLDAEGLIRTKIGRNGGTFTSIPDGSDLTRFVSSFIRGRRVPIRALLEARQAIEASLAFHAAVNRLPEDLAAIEEAQRILEETPDGPLFTQRNLEWHYAVAAASRNDVLTAFLESLKAAIARESAEHAETFEGHGADVRPAVIATHRAIGEAIAAGDGEAAKRRMERHLGAYAATASNATDASVEIA